MTRRLLLLRPNVY